MSRIRVLHLITMLELGGAQQNTLYTVSHLNRNEFEPHLICGAGGMLDDDARGLEGVNVEFSRSLIRPIRPLEDYRAMRDLEDRIRRLKPDIVHTHSSKAGVLGRIAADRAEVPVIIHTYHGFGFHRFQNPLLFRLYLEVEKHACRRAHHLIFVSRENQMWARELNLIDGCSTSLIRSGVDTKELQAAKIEIDIRKELGLPDRSRLIGMVACLKPQKDPLTFVRAADRVTNLHPDVFFLLIGDGELRGRVEAERASMKHPERLLLLGWRRDVASLLHQLDLLALTSLWEGLPRIIPEATIARVPVIAGDIDGNREIVVSGKNGALASVRDPADFASKIETALRESWKVDDGYAAAVAEEFDIETMVKRQEDLYRSLVRGKSG